MTYPPLYPIYSHLIFFNYHNQHYISFRSTRSDATHNRARSALQISDRLSFFGQHMLKSLMLPMCPEEDRKGTSEPELDFRTDKFLSLARPVSSKFIFMLMLTEFMPNLALNQTKYIAATACTQAYFIPAYTVESYTRRILFISLLALIHTPFHHALRSDNLAPLMRAVIYYSMHACIVPRRYSLRLLLTHSYASSTYNFVRTSQYSVFCIQIFDILPLPPSNSRSAATCFLARPQVTSNSSKTRSMFDQHPTSFISASRTQV